MATTRISSIIFYFIINVYAYINLFNNNFVYKAAKGINHFVGVG